VPKRNFYQLWDAASNYLGQVALKIKVKSISFIIPAYNEGSRLSRTLDVYYNDFSNHYHDKWEIIVVCNGCQDNTPQIAAEFARNRKQVRVTNIPQKVGKGGAIMEGLRLADSDICMFLDADGSTSAEESRKLIYALNGSNDAVIGSRKLRNSRIVRKQSFRRRIAGRGFNILIRLLFGLRFKDTQCGAKVLTKEAAQLVLQNVRTTGFTFDVDLLWTLKKNGCVIKEVPIVWEDSLGSTLVLHKVILCMFIEVLKLRLRNG